MKRKVRKQGSSLVVGLSPLITEVMGIKEGEMVNVTLKGNKLEITKIKEGENK